MAEPVLVAEGLCADFGSRGGPKVLAGTSLQVAAAESVAIMGVSGCGKSTLLHILGGLAKPDTGTVKVAGTDLAGLTATAVGRLRNEKMGFVYQDHHLLDEFTAVENVALPMWVAGIARQEAIAKAQELLENVGLPRQGRQLPATLSGGERQRVSIARALANKPDCVIADEPTGNLDYRSANNVTKLLLSACKDQSCALLVATHDRDMAARMDRCLQLVEGRLVVPDDS